MRKPAPGGTSRPGTHCAVEAIFHFVKGRQAGATKFSFAIHHRRSVAIDARLGLRSVNAACYRFVKFEPFDASRSPRRYHVQTLREAAPRLVASAFLETMT
jgi:hypothetical protein